MAGTGKIPVFGPLRLVALFLLFTLFFSIGLKQQPFFIDEGAYLAQTYYYRLVKEGRFNSVDWFHLAAYDQQNVGRFLMGLGLDLRGYELPTSLQDIEAWYGVDEPPSREPPADFDRLMAARWTMLLGASAGCVAAFVLVRQLVGPWTGLLAAVFLAVSPNYHIHAQRAMADDWVMAFALAGFALAHRLGIRLSRTSFLSPKSWILALVAGVFFGLSAGTKLNGATALLSLVVASGFILSAAAPWRNIGPTHSIARTWGVFVLVILLAAGGTFVAINPYFYAHPELPTASDGPGVTIDGQVRSRAWIEDYVRPLAQTGVTGRFKHMLKYRRDVLARMVEENRFPEASLPNVSDRLAAIIRQGMGRWSFAHGFGMAESGSWIPVVVLVLLGLWWCVDESMRTWYAGQLPLSWLLVFWLMVEVVVLSRELTLDWDRYYMGIVTMSAILSAIGIGGTLQSINHKLVLLPPSPIEDSTDAGS